MLKDLKFNLYALCLTSGTMIACSSSSWFSCWLGLEINLMSLIPMLIYKMNSKSSETAIKYFIAQAMASILIMFLAILLFWFNSFNSIIFLNLIIMIALAIKMGAAPLHFWLPQVIQTAEWTQTFIILTWQKIAPMILIGFVKTNFMKILIIFSCLIGVLGAINQTIIKKIFVYSSILHTGWLLSSLLCSEITWFLYFSMYSIIILSVISPLIKLPFSSVKELFFSNLNTISSFSLFLNFLSLAGIPPLLGFLMKLITLTSFVNLNLDLFLLATLIMASLISLFYYLRIMYSSMTISMKKYKPSIETFYKSGPNSFILSISFLGNFISPFFIILS